MINFQNIFNDKYNIFFLLLTIILLILCIINIKETKRIGIALLITSIILISIILIITSIHSIYINSFIKIFTKPILTSIQNKIIIYSIVTSIIGIILIIINNKTKKQQNIS